MTDTTPATDLTLGEMLESLTGFDEIAIRQRFDLDPYMDVESNPVGTTRALIFVHRRRQGDNDAEARKFALDLVFRETEAYFAEDTESDQGNPDTASGKDD